MNPTANTAGVSVNGSNPFAANGTYALDLNINNSLLTNLRVELFNTDVSQLEIYNSSVQNAGTPNYYPAFGILNTTITAGTAANSIQVPLKAANTYVQMLNVAGQDVYVNANAGSPIAAGINTKAYCYFDTNGNANYQPPVLNGVLDPGSVQIQGVQTSYRQMFNAFKRGKVFVTKIKITVPTAYQSNLNQSLTYVSGNIIGQTGNGVTVPGTYTTQNTFQTQIVEFPVNLMLSPKTGFWLNTNAGSTQAAAGVNAMQMHIEFSPAGSSPSNNFLSFNN